MFVIVPGYALLWPGLQGPIAWVIAVPCSPLDSPHTATPITLALGSAYPRLPMAIGLSLPLAANTPTGYRESRNSGKQQEGTAAGGDATCRPQREAVPWPPDAWYGLVHRIQRNGPTTWYFKCRSTMPTYTR
jgi:hypothetical protein